MMTTEENECVSMCVSENACVCGERTTQIICYTKIDTEKTKTEHENKNFYL